MSINQYPKFDPLKKRESAFGEVRSSELTPITHVDFPYNINSRFIKDKSGGGGGIVHASGMAIVSTAASTQSSGILQSVRAAHYTPGQGLHVHVAATFLTGGAVESQQLVGLGDKLCGFFFGYSGVQFGVVHRCVAADDFIPQSEWNKNTYPTLDPTLGNMYSIRLQMGFGQATFGIEDGVTGEVIDVHRMEFSNAQQTPSTLNPHLPINISTLNTGNDTVLSIGVHSAGAFTEGRSFERGIINSSGTTGTAGVALTPIISYRVKDIFQGRENQTIVELLLASANNQSNQAVEFVFIVNGTLTGASFVDFNSDTSVVEIDTAATAISGGSTVADGFVSALLSDRFDMTSLNLELATGNVVTIAARKVSGGADTVDASLIWREVF